MNYDFDTIIARRGTDCEKWDLPAEDGVLPLWVADMDFRAAPAIVDALCRRVEEGVFGYALPSGSWHESLVHTIRPAGPGRRRSFARWAKYACGTGFSSPATKFMPTCRCQHRDMSRLPACPKSFGTLRLHSGPRPRRSTLLDSRLPPLSVPIRRCAGGCVISSKSIVRAKSIHSVFSPHLSHGTDAATGSTRFAPTCMKTT